MLGALARSLFGSVNDRILKGFRKDVAAINALEPSLVQLSDDELKHVLSSNLCRCTGYQNILKAVRAAAAEMKKRAK